MASLPDFPPFNVHEDANAGPRWKKWFTRFERPLCRQNRIKETCGNCGGTYPHFRACPARGKDCKSCGKIGHFARVCRTKPPSSQHVRNVTHTHPKAPPDSDSEPEYVFTIANLSCIPKPPKCQVKIARCSIPVMIDSGASVN